MTRKVLLLLLLTATLLTACSGGKGNTPTPVPPDRDGSQSRLVNGELPVTAEPITVRFATYEWDQGRYEDVVKTFQGDHPNIEIKLISIDEVLGLGEGQRAWPDDAWLRLASSADVITLQAWERSFEPGLARDLTALIDADATFDLDDFYPGALADCQREGGVWCLPVAVSQHLVFFDEDAFDRAEIPYPEPGWTWDDFLSNAAALTLRQGDEVTRWGYIPHPFESLPLAESQVGSLLDLTTDPPMPRFDQTEVIEAVRWYTDLILTHRVAPYFKMEEAMRVYALVEDRKVAMWPGEYLDWPWLSEQRNVGLVPLPGGTPVWAWDTVVMSAGTAHPEAAWRWIGALSQAAGETYRQRLLPARRSVAEGAGGFWDHVKEEARPTLRYAVERGYGTPWAPANRDLRQAPGYKAFFDAIEAVLEGKKSVVDALAEAQVQAKAALLEEAAREAEATPMPAVVVAPSKDEMPSGPDVVTIVFASSFFSSITPQPLKPYRDLAVKFQEMHPEVIVEPKLGTVHSRTTMAEIAQGADCFEWSSSFQESANLEAILSLEPFFEADPTFTADDFYPSLLQPFFWRGQLWGLPSQARPEIVQYNRALFNAGEVPYPAVDWTPDDFLATAIALTRGQGEEKQYGFVDGPIEFSGLMLMLERRGAKLLDTSVDPPTAAFNDPATAEALRWYADLSRQYGAKPVFAGVDEVSAYTEWSELIASGRAAMWTILEGWELVSDRGGLNIGVATIPAGADRAAGAYYYVSGYFISAHTQAGQACWLWITFLTGQPEAVWGVPARRSVVESESYRRQVGDERAAVYEASVAGAERAPSFQLFSDQPWLRFAWFWLSQAHTQVVTGQASVEEALAAAQQTFDDYRACVIVRDAFFDQEEQQACALEVDPALADMLGQ
ncbi:MAG: extracellular solute-binding protein [Anaerolineae bacterium]|nr:MAG: extracellular solute-binding protein [Anaerolineae bacterium]